MKRKFNGFSNGKANIIPVHAQFFSEVLPLIDDLAEMKVVLFCYWALQQKQGTYRYLVRDDFASNDNLMQGLSALDADTDKVLDTALEKAVTDGILLMVEVDLETRDEQIYFVNTARGRKAISQIYAGNWTPTEEEAVEILPERPTIFTLYEENIGALTSGIADRLKDAENDYPYQWIVDAINVAIDNNVRKWSYISKILDSWKAEGRADGSDESTEQTRGEDGRKYITGEYADFIEY